MSILQSKALQDIQSGQCYEKMQALKMLTATANSRSNSAAVERFHDLNNRVMKRKKRSNDSIL